eukprot:TRINITY_DN5079_c0_g1_i5.p1 TRINITY_DN5079_c0_g1~~TRINITY_DN5079_c0_g1_i5.p1  ORF type:complete len:164 (-),score=17.32 TRINITY_DN5079_c0_g1_i5:21-512(-)
MFSPLMEIQEKHPNIVPRIKATVFDSCPSEITPRVLAQAVVALISKRIFSEVRYVQWGVGLLENLWKVNFCRPSIQEITKRLVDLNATVHPLSVNQLYLWSSADVLTVPSYLRTHIEIQKGRGVSCTSWDFGDSPHVAHFKVHEEEYLNQLLPFVRGNLSLCD